MAISKQSAWGGWARKDSKTAARSPNFCGLRVMNLKAPVMFINGVGFRTMFYLPITCFLGLPIIWTVEYG